MTSTAPRRIDSLDFMRGVIMVLMAIDHVRVYAGVPAGGPNPGVFFTRWVTHFSAPGFAFFAGAGIYLMSRKLNDVRALRRFLITRGAFLVVLELTVIREFWTFNVDFKHYMLAGVIWMLGWCMVMMAGLVGFSTRTIGIVGLAIMAAHQLFGVVARVLPGPLGSILYEGGWIQMGEGGMGVLYVLIPWIGVMAAGYAFGTVFEKDPDTRRIRCFQWGLGATAFFLIAGSILAIMAGSQGDGANVPFIFRLLNQRKYPPSQLFLGMTLGPMIALLPFAERLKPRRIWNWLTLFGRVPLFFYLLHIPLIHAAALVVSRIREGAVNPWLFGNHPFAPPDVPPGYRWTLGLLYFVWALCIVALYYPCRWYAQVKASKRYPWMSYV